MYVTKYEPQPEHSVAETSTNVALFHFHFYPFLIVQTWIQLCTLCQSAWRCGRALNCDWFVLNNFCFQVKFCEPICPYFGDPKVQFCEREKDATPDEFRDVMIMISTFNTTNIIY